MARETVAKTPVVGPYPASVAANSLDIAWETADTVNFNQFAPGGDDLLLVWNTDASNPYTFTVTAAPDPYNRSVDVGPYTLQAGEIAQFRIKTVGWVQSDGKVYLAGNNAAIKFAVITL